jgi:hypothetical protein
MKSSAQDFCISYASLKFDLEDSVFPAVTHARILADRRLAFDPMDIHFHFPNLQVLFLESRFLCAAIPLFDLLAKVYPQLTSLSLIGFRPPPTANAFNGDLWFVNLTSFHFQSHFSVGYLMKLLNMLPATLVTLSIADVMREKEESFLEDSWVGFFCDKFKHLQDIAGFMGRTDIVSFI